MTHPLIREDIAVRKKLLDQKYLSGGGDLSVLIDATCLNFGLLECDVEALCAEASQYGFRAVCVPPAFVVSAKKYLTRNISTGQPVPKLCTVVGFPFGYTTLATKKFEVEQALQDGVHEVDVVHSIDVVKEAFHSKCWEALEQEYQTIFSAAQKGQAVVKLILETSLLNVQQIQACVRVAAACGVDVIKTSTGFGTRGASVEDIQVIHNELVALGLEKSVGIKASGGIRTPETAWALVQAGATRLGTRSGVSLLS